MRGSTSVILSLCVAVSLSACSAHQAVQPSLAGFRPASDKRTTSNSIPMLGANLIKDGSFEKPVAPSGGFLVFNTGQSFSKWTVVGASGSIGIVSGTFSQNGFTFPAGCSNQWVDLTGLSQSATGVSQTVTTVKTVTTTEPIRGSTGSWQVSSAPVHR